MKVYMFSTKEKISEWICGVEFRGGSYITLDEAKAEELRKESGVYEVTEQEPVVESESATTSESIVEPEQEKLMAPPKRNRSRGK